MTSSTTAVVLVALLLGFPLLGSLLNAGLGERLGRGFVNLVGTVSILASFGVGLAALVKVQGEPESHRALFAHLWNWVDIPNGFHTGFDFTVDPLSVLMILVITGVGFLIHVYAVGYMEHDSSVHRFFSYMNFFVFSMLVLVVAADLVLLIIGWALVALSSYLLIGYYYDRPSAVLAARKAFITQVIGDIALVLATFLVVTHLTEGNDGSGGLLSTTSMPTLFDHAASFTAGGGVVTWICLLLAIGAFAKSAQFPLHTWLPDAMEGPTPVSALIHAATMVTAGVYLVARFHPLFDRAPVAQSVVATVGIGTALMAGIIAISQIDIKRVIAYSTMSQIGLMIFAVGLGAYTAGMYHFLTHAIFKALLFMAAGNVIHALHDEQDIRLMGGLSSTLRRTEICFLSGTLALAGILPFAGWFSKENLLGFGLASGPVKFAAVLYVVGVVINILTGLYAIRLWATVFRGEPQTARGYAAHEAPRTMLVPVMILAALSAVAGLVLLWPIPNSPVHVLSSFLEPVFSQTTAGVAGTGTGEPSSAAALIGLVVGTLASLIGAGVAMRLWYQRDRAAWAAASRIPRALTQLSFHKFYFDELYDVMFVRPGRALASACRRLVEPRVMDGWVTGIVDGTRGFGDVVKSWQTGLIRDYASVFVLGIAACGVMLYLSVR